MTVLFFQGEEHFEYGLAANSEFLRQVYLHELVSKLDDPIENRLADLLNYEDRYFSVSSVSLARLRGEGCRIGTRKSVPGYQAVMLLWSTGHSASLAVKYVCLSMFPCERIQFISRSNLVSEIAVAAPIASKRPI
jgi:hypothetical protein